MAMAAAGARLPNPWEAMGRETEVGRSLFALYNGYGVARNRGNKYSDSNRMKIMERISTQGPPDLYLIPPDPPKSKKPIVKVPRFHKKFMTLDDIPQVLLMRGRRKGSQILIQLKKDMSLKDKPPASKKPLLDEKEKARLQEIFEWSGRDVEDAKVEPELPKAPRKPPPEKGSVEEQEMLIEAIAKEIEERKLFLDKMFELGRGPKYEPIIRLEIQERVRQMELLDKNISHMDKERLEGEGQQYARSSTQLRHMSMCEEKPYSKTLFRQQPQNASNPQNAHRDSKIIAFEEQLNTIRKENMIRKGDQTTKPMQDDDVFTELGGDESISDMSYIRHPYSSANNKLKYNVPNNYPEQHQTMNIETRPSASLKTSDECDSVSMASPNSTKCSSIHSGTIRSSLRSIKSPLSIRSDTMSSSYSTLCT